MLLVLRQMNLRVPHPSRLLRRVGSYDPKAQPSDSSLGSFLGHSRLFPLCHPDRSALFASRVPLTGMAGFFFRAVPGAPATKRRDRGIQLTVSQSNATSQLFSMPSARRSRVFRGEGGSSVS